MDGEQLGGGGGGKGNWGDEISVNGESQQCRTLTKKLTLSSGGGSYLGV